MLFDDKFIENIKNDPARSIIDIIDTTFSNSSDLNDWGAGNNKILTEAYSFILAISDDFKLPIKTLKPELKGTIQDNCILIYKFLNNIKIEFNEQVTLMQIETATNQFKAKLGQSFAYEFSQDDLDRIQVLINELREEIKSSDLFESEHKERLLKRLEKLQAEMHKRMSDIDKIWGLIGDMGIVMGKFGKDAKPLTDRIREIFNISWRNQSKAEELALDVPPPSLY